MTYETRNDTRKKSDVLNNRMKVCVLPICNQRRMVREKKRNETIKWNGVMIYLSSVYVNGAMMGRVCE